MDRQCRDEEIVRPSQTEIKHPVSPYVIVFAAFLLFLEAVVSCFFSMEPRRQTDLKDVYRWIYVT